MCSSTTGASTHSLAAAGPRSKPRAFLVLSAAGLDAGSYSFAYVARWSGGEPQQVAKTADRVITCARTIVDGLGIEYQESVA